VAILTEPKKGAHIFLYDGVCGLCNKLVQFTLPRDPHGKFQFASLQSDFSAKLLAQYKLSAQDLNTFYVIADYGLATQRVLSKSDAGAFVLSQIGGFWTAISAFRFLPKALRNWGYDLVAKNRYRIFGKNESCRMPDPSTRDRFIEV
jgi:predicted DCC family thiol-disulfide oxidoreductase YuxK